jgi:hypothetical protein
MNEVVEVKIEERGSSELCDCHVMVSLSYALNNSRDRRRCVRWIIRIGGVINSSLMDGLFETAVTDSLISFNTCTSLWVPVLVSGPPDKSSLLFAQWICV